jgi:hypothetical protein
MHSSQRIAFLVDQYVDVMYLRAIFLYGPRSSFAFSWTGFRWSEREPLFVTFPMGDLLQDHPEVADRQWVKAMFPDSEATEYAGQRLAKNEMLTMGAGGMGIRVKDPFCREHPIEAARGFMADFCDGFRASRTGRQDSFLASREEARHFAFPATPGSNFDIDFIQVFSNIDLPARPSALMFECLSPRVLGNSHQN